MAQIPSISDLPAQEDLLVNSSQVLPQRLGKNQHIKSPGLSPRRAPPPVPRKFHGKPVPVRSQEQVSLNPFRSAHRQKTDAVPVERSLNPYRSALRTHASSSENATEDAPVFIGVVGITGSGKSSLINRVTGCEDVKVFDGLKSGTDRVNQASLQIGPTTINLVDTPGFNDTRLEDEDVYYMLIEWLKDFHKKGQKLSGLIYLHPINKTREKGSDVRSLKIFKKLVGRDNFDNIVIGLTFYDVEDSGIAASRERTLRESPDFWADLITAGATVVKIPFEKDACISLIAKMARKKRIILQAEHELFNENKAAAETSAMKEIKDHEELKIIRLKEEMEHAAQQLLFQERLKFAGQLSAEREALEQQLFEEREEKHALEEEVLMWKAACEKEKEDAKGIKLQHGREEELRKQKTEQEKREKEAEEEREKNEKALKDIEEKKNIDHAESQINKILAYLESKETLFNTYYRLANLSKAQDIQITGMMKGGVFLIGDHCIACWSVLPVDEPMILYSSSSTKPKSIAVCSSDQCLTVAKTLMDQLSWKPRWHFALLTSNFQCTRLTPRGLDRLICSRCYRQKQMPGFYWHCCECDDDDFDLCLECWAIKEVGCREKDKHILRLAFFWEPDARYPIQRTPHCEAAVQYNGLRGPGDQEWGAAASGYPYLSSSSSSTLHPPTENPGHVRNTSARTLRKWQRYRHP